MKVETWGDFEVFLDRVVGRGGTSVVYEARQVSLDRPCVVKVLETRDPALREELLARFRNEARLIARVREPRIIPVYQSGEHQGRLWLAMERADGGTLEERIASGTLIPEAEAMRIGREIARGLESVYEQERIIHRDIKPSNVFLTRKGEIRIADFGLAKVVTGRPSKLTDTGTVMGTPAYLAPEVIRGEPVDHRADIYALGCLIYEMLVQLPPFDGDTSIDVMYKHVHQEPPAPRELRPDVSEELNGVVMRCLKKDKEARFQTYRELIAALEAEPAPEPSPANPPSRRNVILAATVVAAVAFVAWILIRAEPAPASPPPAAPAAQAPEPPPLPAEPDLESLRAALRKDPRKALEMGLNLSKAFPDRKDIADLLFRARLACGEIREETADPAYRSMFRHLRNLEFATVAELERLVRTADELQQQAADDERDAVERALALAVASVILDRVGAEREAAVLKDRAQQIVPCQIQNRGRGSYAPLIASAVAASKSGDWSIAKRLRAIAQRFSLQPVLDAMSGVERELHAAELMEMGNDVDVLQNHPGTRAFAQVAAKVRNDWRGGNRKNWIASPEAWTKRGPDLTRSRFEFAERGLSIDSASPAYAECSVANAEQGLAIELEVDLESTGWAAIVVNPEAPAHVSIFADRVEVTLGGTVRANKPVHGSLRVELIPYRDHLLIFLQGEILHVLPAVEGALDSVVRVGVCKGKLAVRKAEVPE